MAAKCASLNRHGFKENLYEKNIDREMETGVIRRTVCYSRRLLHYCGLFNES